MNTHQQDHEPFAQDHRSHSESLLSAAVAFSADTLVDAFKMREDIRLCAFHKWEAAGKPAGDGLPFWLEAEHEVAAARNERLISRGDRRVDVLANDVVPLGEEPADADPGVVGFVDSNVIAAPGEYADDGTLETQATEENAKALDASVGSHYRDNNRMFQRHGNRGHRHGAKND